MSPAGRLAGLIVILPFMWACGGGEEPVEEQPPLETASGTTSGQPAGGEDGTSTLKPLTFRRVTVYFPSVYGNGLLGEPREIFETNSPVDRAKQILSDLLAGPNDADSLPALPQGIRLRQVYVMDSGVAYADFSSELTRRIGGGSMEEILAVYSIVNSLVLNVEEIERVGILMDGQPCETLNGHLDLRRPLPANLRLMKN